VHVDVQGFASDDDYFHLAPGRERRLLLRPTGEEHRGFSGTVHALNADAPVAITVAS
jgi:hypothetical protein